MECNDRVERVNALEAPEDRSGPIRGIPIPDFMQNKPVVQMADLSDSQVHSFWRWFATVARALAESLEHAAILEELDQRVADFGPISWEVGPGISRANALVLSPSGSAELLQLTERLVALVPDIPDWEFHSTKPAKSWDLKFFVEDRERRPRLIDANEWEYVLLRYSDGKFEILVRAPNLADTDPGTRYTAVEEAVTGLIGERRLIEAVDSIDVVDNLEDSHLSKRSRFPDLARQLDALLQRR